jgi:Txe/YoeB family toxin of Txe-Axe toxin-antitoxin module
MSKKQKISTTKKAQNAIKKAMADDFTTQLKSIFNTYEKESKKGIIEIEKTAKQLAEKLSKRIKNDKLVVTKDQNKKINQVKDVVATSPKVTEKPVPTSAKNSSTVAKSQPAKTGKALKK